MGRGDPGAEAKFLLLKFPRDLLYKHEGRSRNDQRMQ